MNKHCFLAKSLGVLSLCTENISFKKSFKLSSFSFKKKAEEGLEAEGMASTSAKGSKDKAACSCHSYLQDRCSLQDAGSTAWQGSVVGVA